MKIYANHSNQSKTNYVWLIGLSLTRKHMIFKIRSSARFNQSRFKLCRLHQQNKQKTLLPKLASQFNSFEVIHLNAVSYVLNEIKLILVDGKLSYWRFSLPAISVRLYRYYPWRIAAVGFNQPQKFRSFIRLKQNYYNWKMISVHPFKQQFFDWITGGKSFDGAPSAWNGMKNEHDSRITAKLGYIQMPIKSVVVCKCRFLFIEGYIRLSQSRFDKTQANEYHEQHNLIY